MVDAIPATGIFHDAESKNISTSAELLSTSGAWISSLVSRPPPRAEEAQVAWDKSTAERQLGILQGWFAKEELDAARERCAPCLATAFTVEPHSHPRRHPRR